MSGGLGFDRVDAECAARACRQVEFLGTYCLAALEVEGFDGQRMLVYFSLNQALELGVREGASIPFALRGERVRVFAQTA